MRIKKYPDLASLSLFYVVILFVNSAVAEREVNSNEDINDVKLNSLDQNARKTEVEKPNSPEYEAEAENKVQDIEFSYDIHPGDHSVYAQRSLMSRENIGLNISHDENVAEEDFEALKRNHFAEREWNLMFRAFDQMYSDSSSSVLEEIGQKTQIVEEVITRLKPECQREINHMRDSLKQHKLWALRMIDAYGKLPSGISYGRFSSPGDYEECLSINVDELVHRGKDSKQLKPEHHKFRGKYCLLDFRLPLPKRPPGQLMSIHDPIVDLSKTEVGAKFPELKNYSGYASVFYEVGYLHAFCLPSVCDVKDMTNSLGEALEGLHIIVNNTVDCQVESDQPAKWIAAQIISMALLTLVFVNACIASFMHYLIPSNIKSDQKNRGLQSQNINTKELEAQLSSNKPGFMSWAVLKSIQNQYYPECFSFQSNFERLTKPDPRGLTFVHYTRIVAMALTVVTHTAGMGTLEAITKPADASNSEQIFRDFLPQMLANAFTSIQIFFFMAGFMLVISTYPSIKRDPTSVSFLEYAIKRAIRLMPGLAATIAVNFLWPLIVDGPMLAYFVRRIVTPCETNWWRTMAFLSNFDHVEAMCLRHSYFSASDYQLHMMAFPVLILLYKKPALSLAIAGLLTFTGFAAQVIMVLTKTILPFMMVDYIDKEAFFNVVHYIHHPVWNHMSAFFYGFIIGYLVVKQIRVNLSTKTIKILWYIIMPLGIASIFAPYFWNHYKRPIYKWQMVLYVIIDRFILLTTCAWLSYATMVLARPAPNQRFKSTTTTTTTTSNINLPNIVSLEREKVTPTSEEELRSRHKTNATIEGTEASVEDKMARLTTNSDSSTSIPRQRSSPNFLSLSGNEKNSTEFSPSSILRPAISSSNVNSTRAYDEKKLPSRDELSENSASNPQAKKQSSLPIANVNTLCLVLSRLTFQLYLFNMVVLWVDVNHSKYYWFFSYYFIITKAFAVYIFSAIMAMIFFVTMESPSLTLYIMWVKARAQARAFRRSKVEEDIKESKIDEQNKKINTKSNNIMHNNQRVSGDSQNGLQMRLGAPIGDKPSFSFIDLSTPSDIVSDNQTTTQTKM